MEALGSDFTIACPAFPEAARTICRGYLFVGDMLLSESGMKEHPLTPMTDANLVRVLQAQTKTADSRAAFGSAAQQFEKTLGFNHPDTRIARQLAELDHPAQ